MRDCTLERRLVLDVRGETMAKMVICEDDRLLQKLMLRILRTTVHDIYMASDGCEGLTLIERERPDLILTDISMPHSDGFQLAAAVRANPHLASIPIIFLTGFTQQYDRQEAASYNPIAYLVKPFSTQVLRTIIESALAVKKGENGGNTQDTL